MREAAAKVAVDLLDHLDPADRTLASVVRISEQLVHYFRDGVQWSVPPVQQPVQQQQYQQADPPHNPGSTQGLGYPDQGQQTPPSGWPAPDDDGIPF